MANHPVLVEATRGGLVESRHRGMVAVVDARGKLVFSIGDSQALVFPRSACKAMQALPLVESGAADAYGFGNRELALAASSHSGEDAHAELALSMLSRAGRGEETFECGAHWSFEQQALIHQARTLTRPTAAHNNCSGKHAGFICTACHSGINPEGYVKREHPIQEETRAIMESLTGGILGEHVCGIDGCSIPAYAMPLAGLASGFAKLATGEKLEPLRARAARRIIEACMAEPFYVAGTKRACTELMQIAPGKIFAKTGAEGFFCAALPEKGLGIALKCEDGATRAAEAMVAGVMARFFDAGSAEQDALLSFANRPMRNWNGHHVGDIRITEALRA